MTAATRPRAAAIARYRAQATRLDDGRWEVMVVVWGGENPILDGWDVCGVAVDADPAWAEREALTNLRRTLSDTGIRAATRPMEG